MSQPITRCRFAGLLIATVLTFVGTVARAAPLFSDLTPSASVNVSGSFSTFDGTKLSDSDFFDSMWYTGTPISNQAIGTYTWGTTQHVGYVLLSGSEAGRVPQSLQLQYSVDGSTGWTNAGSTLTPAAQSLFYVPMDLNVKGVRVILNSSTSNQALSGMYVYGNNDLSHPVQMNTTSNLFGQATETHTGTWEIDGAGFSALGDTNVGSNNISPNYVRANAFAAGAPPTMLFTYAQEKSLSGLALANQVWYYSGGMINAMHIDALNEGIDPNLATAGDWTTVYTYSSDNTLYGSAKLISAQFDNVVLTRALRLVITGVSNTVNDAGRAGGGISEIDVIGGFVPEPASLSLLMLGGAALLRPRAVRV